MRKYETPEIDLVMDSQYLEHAQKVVVTLVADSWRKDYSTADGTATIVKTGHVYIQPKQDDTEEAPANTMVNVQVSILNESGARIVSDVARIPLLWTAYDEVME